MRIIDAEKSFDLNDLMNIKIICASD